MCEKSDGVRVLLFISTLGETQSVFLVCAINLSDYWRSLNAYGGLIVYQLDRHNNYHKLEGFYFPHHEDPRLPLKNTLVDGELVVDVDPQTKRVREP